MHKIPTFLFTTSTKSISMLPVSTHILFYISLTILDPTVACSRIDYQENNSSVSWRKENVYCICSCLQLAGALVYHRLWRHLLWFEWVIVVTMAQVKSGFPSVSAWIFHCALYNHNTERYAALSLSTSLQLPPLQPPRARSFNTGRQQTLLPTGYNYYYMILHIAGDVMHIANSVWGCF